MTENISSCLLYFIAELLVEVAQFRRMMSALILSHWKPRWLVGLQKFFIVIFNTVYCLLVWNCL